MSNETEPKPKRQPSPKQLAYWETLKGKTIPGKSVSANENPYDVNGCTISPPNETCDRYVICDADGNEIDRTSYTLAHATHIASQI